MLKKDITYVDPFENVEVTDTFYFHLYQSDVIELQAAYPAGWLETLQLYIENDDRENIIEAVKLVIRKSIGRRTERGFYKSDAIRDEFVGSEAYSSLFIKLLKDTDELTEFVNGITPKVMTKAEAIAAGIDPERTPFLIVDEEATPEEVKVVTREELAGMSDEELRQFGLQLTMGKVRIGEPQEAPVALHEVEPEVPTPAE